MVPEGHYKIELGKAEIVQEGDDITMIAWGTQVHVAKEVAEIAQRDMGVSIEVIDLGFDLQIFI